MLLNGTRLGPYEVQSHIGAGGMGDVYRGWDARLARAVALKVLPPSLTNSPSALERFRREARAIAALSHPNICTVHDVGAVRVNDDPDDTPFIVMELLEGETLEQRLARGPCDVREIIDVGVALTGALAAAHAEGIVHRDIKPANVFLTKHGPKILDFGIAKMVSPEGRDAAGAAASLATTPGVALGTVAYMSPEQVVGAELDARTDLFSLGLVLYRNGHGEHGVQRANANVDRRGDHARSGVLADGEASRSAAATRAAHPQIARKGPRHAIANSHRAARGSAACAA